jgi:hypothetical protein
MPNETKTVLINYDFAPSSQLSREEIAGTDKRNLWCAILRDNLKSHGIKLLFPNDISGLHEFKVDLEIHVNAGIRRSSARHTIGLFMETPEIAPQNNVSSCRNYDKVISFNPNLNEAGNHVMAELPCWDADDLSQAFQKNRDCASNTFSMIAANKNFRKSVTYKDLYKERIKVIEYFETSQPQNFKLFGHGWNVRRELLALPRLQKISRTLGISGNLRSYEGVCISKNQVIKNSTFNICYENCVYPGYLSEKVFDAILGGAIPIYWGHHGIPQTLKASVIDASHFKSPRELIRHCSNLSITERLEITENGTQFLKSDGLRHTHQKYAMSITSCVNQLLNV